MIGVLGGTFDPIHYGHLRSALEMQQALGLEEIRFVPLAVAVHRNQPAATAAQRVEMVRAAIAGQSGFLLDEREIRRKGRSYTFDTLAGLRRELPDTPICLLVGGDAFNDFLGWHRPLDILALAHLGIMQRPGVEPAADPALARLIDVKRCDDPARLRATRAGLIHFHPVTQLDISSTTIRRQANAGVNPRFLLPDAVAEVIERERLYR